MPLELALNGMCVVVGTKSYSSQPALSPARPPTIEVAKHSPYCLNCMYQREIQEDFIS